MSAVEVVAKHRAQMGLLYNGALLCDCRARFENEHAWAAHMLDALAAAGFVVIQLPKPAPKSDLYDMHFDVLSDDYFMQGPRTPHVCIDSEVGEIYQVCTPTAHITPAEARSLAAALLAAAAEVSDVVS